VDVPINRHWPSVASELRFMIDSLLQHPLLAIAALAIAASSKQKLLRRTNSAERESG
jgi:hypothetical protein